jgi:hypothetical protein
MALLSVPMFRSADRLTMVGAVAPAILDALGAHPVLHIGARCSRPLPCGPGEARAPHTRGSDERPHGHDASGSEHDLYYKRRMIACDELQARAAAAERPQSGPDRLARQRDGRGRCLHTRAAKIAGAGTNRRTLPRARAAQAGA